MQEIETRAVAPDFASITNPIDSTGAYVLRVSVKGPESTSFRLELGGDAMAAR